MPDSRNDHGKGGKMQRNEKQKLKSSCQNAGPWHEHSIQNTTNEIRWEKNGTSYHKDVKSMMTEKIK